MFKTPLAATATALALLAAPAVAKTGAWQVGNDSIHLYYDDLDMNSAAGRAALLGRVERAAERLCRDSGDARACVTSTVADVSRGAQGGVLRLALNEHADVQLAAR